MTIVSIILTGILGNIVADGWFKLVGIKEPIAKGLALGTSAHAIGTAKALELGEVEGADEQPVDRSSRSYDGRCSADHVRIALK